MLLVTS